MAFVMTSYVQSVVVEGTVYAGGGYAGYGSDNVYIVMTYDISTGKWATLPPYRAREFAMTAINNQLVLVGGEEHGNRVIPCQINQKKLTPFSDFSETWFLHSMYQVIKPQ